MSETSATSGAARNNDRDLDEMKNAHEKKMALLRAKQQKEESDLQQSGEAAVNHIRKSTADRVASAQSESETKIDREGASIAKDYSTLKRRATENTITNEKEIAASKEHTDQRIASDKNREEFAFTQSQEKLKDFLAKQRDLRNATERKSADEMRETEKRNSTALRKASETNQNELRTVETDHKERMHELGEESRETYEETKAQAQRRTAQYKADAETHLKHEIETDNDAFKRVHQKSHDDVEKTQAIGQARLSQSIEQNQRKLEGDREKSLALNEKLQREYSREGQRVEIEGNADVDSRKQKFNRLLTEQKVNQHQELTELQKNNQAQQERLKHEGEGHIKETVVKLRDELHHKEDQFAKEYAAEDKANHDTLSGQKEIFLKEQYKQRTRQDQEVYVDESRRGDKFYKPQSFNASIDEHDDKYVLTAKVPAYEKDNVEVRVKDGKVTLSSARQFKNSVKDGDAKMETATHQSYRQEIALAKPADSKRVLTTVSENGDIRSIIPKKGFTKI